VSQPVTLMNYRKRPDFARCECCGGKKPRSETPWKPSDPIVPCPNCVNAGCVHKWRDTFTRGKECPARARGRRLRACQGSGGKR